MAWVATNDSTAIIKNVVPGAGSFVVTLNAAAMAETAIGFECTGNECRPNVAREEGWWVPGSAGGGRTRGHLPGVPRVSPSRRIPLDGRDVETSRAEGQPALQALWPCAREPAGTLAAHAAEPGIVTRRMPSGLAALTRSDAQWGTGDGGPAVTRADGIRLPREPQLRGRDDGARFGQGPVARTGSRTPGEPGMFPLEAQVNLPTRGDADFRQAWMTGLAVAPPCHERASGCEPRVAREVAESAVMAVPTAAPAADAACEGQRPRPSEDPEGALLGVSVDGRGPHDAGGRRPRATPSGARARSGRSRQQRWWGVALPSIPSPGLPKPWRRAWSSRPRCVPADHAKT